MPIYDYQCNKSTRVFERFAGVEEKTARCKCGSRAKRIFSANYYVHSDIDFVTDNLTGDPVRVGSRVQLKRLCEENGVTPKIGKGWV